MVVYDIKHWILALEFTLTRDGVLDVNEYIVLDNWLVLGATGLGYDFSYVSASFYLTSPYTYMLKRIPPQ